MPTLKETLEKKHNSFWGKKAKSFVKEIKKALVASQKEDSFSSSDYTVEVKGNYHQIQSGVILNLLVNSKKTSSFHIESSDSRVISEVTLKMIAFLQQEGFKLVSSYESVLMNVQSIQWEVHPISVFKMNLSI